jgi:hypothetical protein
VPPEDTASNSSPFTVTTTPPGALKLKPGARGTFSFTVTSLEGPDRKREVVLQALLIDAAGKTMEVDWLEAGPSRTLMLSGGETTTVTIQASPTAKIAPGVHSLKLAVADNADPSDTYAYSAPVTCEVEKPTAVEPAPGPGLPKWLIPVIVGAVVLVAGIITVVLLVGGGEDPLALGQPCKAGSTPCAQGLVCAAEQQTCLRPTGGACAADTECETKKCTNGACVAQPSKAGDPCDGTCPAPLQCSPSGHCGDQLGRPCEQDVQCFSGVCDSGRCVDSAVGTLKVAIAKVTATPSSWPAVLQEALGKLNAPEQSTQRDAVRALLEGAQAAQRAGTLCTVELIGGRVLTHLESLKDRLLGEPPTTPTPFVCGTNPLSVEFAKWQAGQVPSVKLIGFGLVEPLRVQLVQTTGPSVAGFTSPGAGGFQASIDLGPAGVRLTTASQRILVVTSAQPPVEIAVINVVQPQPKICQERDLTVQLVGTVNLVPTLRRGDSEFNGHGPRIIARLELLPAGSQVNYVVTMTATETIADFTTLSGTRTGALTVSPAVPANHRITRLNGTTVSTVDFTDRSHAQDFIRPVTGPVSEFVFTGDIDGLDVGRTQLHAVKFRSIGIHVIETGSCVTR